MAISHLTGSGIKYLKPYKMKIHILRLLLSSLVLLPLSITGQGLDKASTISYGASGIITELEPAENGLRNTFGSSITFDYEFRFGKKVGLLLSLPIEIITSRKSPVTSADIPEPDNMVHPYRSALSGVYLLLGAQYNYEIGAGDLSFGMLVGAGPASYSRTWDVLKANVEDGIIQGTSHFISGSTDNSTGTWRLKTTARVQYTYWISKELAFSLGMEYTQSNYLGGGIMIGDQLRYDFRTREFTPTGRLDDQSPLIYDVNYDLNTLTSDPGNTLRQLRFTIGVTSKI